MKKLLLTALLFVGTQSFGFDIKCEMYGIGCPLPCDSFAKSNPTLKNYYNDGAICVSMLKYTHKLKGKINLILPIENSTDVYVDLKDGSKLMLVNGRKFFYEKRRKEDDLEKKGFKIHGMSTTVKHRTFASSGSNAGKNFVDAVMKFLKSDEIAKDDCEIIRDTLDKSYGDLVSDREKDREAKEICKEVHEKAERNRRDIEKIRDRM